MNIALDATPLSVPTGGVARYTLELTRALAQYYPNDRYLLLSDRLFSQRPIGVAIGDPPKSFLDRRWWTRGLNREMERHCVELFHGTDFSVPYIPKRPSVMTVHDLSPWIHAEWQRAATRIRRRTSLLLRLRVPTMVITPSESVRRAMIDRFGLAPDRVAAVPLAASENFRPVDAPVPKCPYFLFVGTLEPRKNIGRLIEAWRSVKEETGADLILAGRIRDDFEAPTSEPGLRILGAVAEEELPALYSSALAVVYPSLYEGFGLPVLEAMQCGAVVITSRDPAILEVTGGEAAIHMDATDMRALAEALRNAGKMRFLRDRALARAREFSWRRTAEKTREVYGEAVRLFSHA